MSFFFRRDAECSDPDLVLPTIAYQLAHSRPELMARIVSAVKEYVHHGQFQGISHQGQQLFLDIIRDGVDHERPLALVMDSVDECLNSSPGLKSSLLHLICQAVANIQSLRVLIATRPESYMMSTLPTLDDNSAILRNLWTDSVNEISEDIRQYIQAEIDQRVRKGNFILLEERPNAVAQLTQLSAG
ncbi:hypothetical protein CERSUDRAFT_123413 [Gelatoporia subvermispora B]|uniref:Nephrocystin 3-like N-terminal domain-containing protein n=1 Tax=Ceriporiopsis subvermispora (strain B) TaxID=914234 RepID=M2RF93_CERS8|nr:hypothetical protein CERSUDRAFT_123413 [Gelatoporia subvermispora B]